MSEPLIIAMDSDGRLVLPESVRQVLQLEGATRFAVEVTENALILRPVTIIAGQGADWRWATGPDPRARRAD